MDSVHLPCSGGPTLKDHFFSRPFSNFTETQSRRIRLSWNNSALFSPHHTRSKKKRHVCLEAGTAGVHLSESERTESVCLGARRGPEKLLPLSLGEREKKKTRPEILLVDRMSVVSACPNPPDPFLGKGGKSDGASHKERRKRVQLAIDGLAS